MIFNPVIIVNEYKYPNQKTFDFRILQINVIC